MLFTRVSQKRVANNFEYYDSWLIYILRMLLEWDLSEMPPHVFALLARQLANVAPFLDRGLRKRPGTSWAATETWAREGEHR